MGGAIRGGSGVGPRANVVSHAVAAHCPRIAGNVRLWVVEDVVGGQEVPPEACQLRTSIAWERAEISGWMRVGVDAAAQLASELASQHTHLEQCA